MKTLEERAQICVDSAYQGYIIGANEQKAIDDKECESLVRLAVKEARQVFVDKACEWITVKGVFCGDTCGDLKRYVEDFRKAMEEQK